MTDQNVIAIIFDCDDTLCRDTTTFVLQKYDIDTKLFWSEVADTVKVGWDPPLAYMFKILELVRSGKMPNLSNKRLRQIGSEVRFFKGIPEVFGALSKLVQKEPDFVSAGVSIEFYVATSGFEEVVEGSAIAPYMKEICGCTFAEDPKTGLIKFPKSTVTFTEKTKFIFSINKGISKAELRESPYRVNDSIKEEDRRIPFRNMIYLGDGPSDIPCFSLIMANGGHGIGVSRKGAISKGYELARGRRITAGPFSCNYSRGSDLRRYLFQNVKDIAWEIVTRRRLRFRTSPTHS